MGKKNKLIVTIARGEEPKQIKMQDSFTSGVFLYNVNVK